MTVVNPKSISGINSITMASGGDDLLTIHSNNTTERVRVNNSGDVIVGSGVTLSPDGDIFATGVCTATSFSGDGSSLTGIAATDNVRTGILDVAGVGTFRGDVNIPDKIIHLGDTDTAIRFAGDDIVTIETGGSERVRVDSAGLKIADKLLHSGDIDTAIRFPDADTITAETGGSERLRITSTGNFGLATNSPVAQTLTDGTAITPVLDLKGVTQNNTSGILQFTRKDHVNQGSCIYSSGEDAGLTFRNTDGNGFGFYNGTTNALRIKTDGKIGINCTPDYLFNVVSSTVDTCRFQQTTNNDATSYSLIFMKHAAARSGSNGVDITFQNDSGTTVGMIDHGQSTTQYRTSSDYRLKENAETISDGITRLKTLKPYRFNWISEPGQPKVDGFFAHEVTAVPEAIKGTKDEVDSDNKPVYQAIDHSKLVPLLTAALQEAITEIETLKTKVAALESA